MLVGKIKILSQKPEERLIKKAREVIAEKDAVILVEAKQVKTGVLVTLDKKHFFQKKVEDFLKPQRLATPKMLVESR